MKTRSSKKKTSKRTKAVARRKDHEEQGLVKYDPEIEKLLKESIRDESSEQAELQKDAGLPRLNLKTAPNEMLVSILAQQRANAYWEEPFKAGESQAPDCASSDGDWGDGKRFVNGEYEEGRRECESCPLNQFGSGGSGRGKACRNMRVLFIQNLEHQTPSPELLVIPPTGLKACSTYLRGLIHEGKPRWATQTLIEKVADDATPFGAFAYSQEGPVTPEQMRMVAPLYKSFRDGQKRAQSFKAEDLGEPAEQTTIDL